MSQFTPEPTTKDKLNSIVQGFDDFDLEMRKGTRLRREKDEFRITELKNHMSKLEEDLTVEIKRRTEMNKSTQIWFEDKLTNVHKDVTDRVEKRRKEVLDTLQALTNRVDSLEKYIELTKLEILKKFDERGEELRALLYAFKEEFDEDRKLRLEREEVIVKQLTDHEQLVAENFQVQIDAREARYIALRSMLEDNINLREKTESNFQAFFDKEINKLKNEFRNEVEIREREDDEIIEALNRYTLKLQTSLRVVNSTDM